MLFIIWQYRNYKTSGIGVKIEELESDYISASSPVMDNILFRPKNQSIYSWIGDPVSQHEAEPLEIISILLMLYRLT